MKTPHHPFFNPTSFQKKGQTMNQIADANIFRQNPVPSNIETSSERPSFLSGISNNNNVSKDFLQTMFEQSLSLTQNPTNNNNSLFSAHEQRSERTERKPPHASKYYK